MQFIEMNETELKSLQKINKFKQCCEYTKQNIIYKPNTVYFSVINRFFISFHILMYFCFNKNHQYIFNRTITKSMTCLLS